jgi:photosystem II stability/assembly factor-like uncharacterized protein
VDTAQASYFDIEFVNPQIGYAACGIYTSATPCVIRKTTNGGDAWSTVASMDAGTDFEAVSFVDTLLGWTLSYSYGQVFRTTDGGISWTYQDSVGRLSNGETFPMRDIKFTTADSGWAIGGLGGTSVMARTTDGGIHWTISSRFGSSLAEIAMVNSRLGWIIGRLYNVPPLLTTDGGETWNPQSTSPPILGFDLSSISMVNSTLGWVVCQGGRAYKTNNGGVVRVADNHILPPQQIWLDQNFPNPFNPSTLVSYSLPHSSFVELTIYNMLGQQVAQLVHEEQDAGDHHVEFRPDGLASGVYLCQLCVVGELSQVRKLIFLR